MSSSAPLNFPENLRPDYFWGSAMGRLQNYADGSNYRYYAPLDENKCRIPMHVDDWWNQEVAILYKSVGVTRKHLILDAANKDGGAHVDSKLDNIYGEYAEDNSVGEIKVNGGVIQFSTGIKNTHHVAIRQIAYEILNSSELLAICK